MTSDEYAKIESLILERLRRMEERFDRLDAKVDMGNAQMRVLSTHVAGLVGSEALNEQRFASIDEHLDRLDRRLELVDER